MIRYEANPPKVLPGSDTAGDMRRFVERIRTVSKKCDAIHLTEDVLGMRRISPLDAGRVIREELPGLPVTASLRVRDKSREEIFGFVEECASIGFEGVLVVMGDPSRSGRADTGQIPSRTVASLREAGFGSRIRTYLSVPSDPDCAGIRKKIEAGPDGFMTQVVQSAVQIQGLRDRLAGFDLVPILLYPSEKNRRSAEFLNLDMDRYGRDFGELVRRAEEITGDVLITSPSDHGGLEGFLDSIRG